MPKTTQAEGTKDARSLTNIRAKVIRNHAPRRRIAKAIQERPSSLMPPAGPELQETGGRKRLAEEPVWAMGVQEGVQALETELDPQQAAYDLRLRGGWEPIRKGQGEPGDEIPRSALLVNCLASWFIDGDVKWRVPRFRK